MSETKQQHAAVKKLQAILAAPLVVKTTNHGWKYIKTGIHTQTLAHLRTLGVIGFRSQGLDGVSNICRGGKITPDVFFK